jgi:YidC/Oxa1 family membrane protein insertase
VAILGLVWDTFWHTLLNILVAINSVVHNPGISIILFTILMRLLIVPVNMRALRSSRNMQAIQPIIKEVQKKYGKDRQKQQEELMKVYHQYGVNPTASCFPLLLQFPIFIGLYSALQFTLHITATTDLSSILWVPDWKQWANFSGGFLWVPNLAASDPMFVWPILSGLFQFIQSRMSMPVRDPSMPMDPQQKMMQNVMQFMPLYIVFISWGFPAGNVIYWAFSSLFGAVQQYFITGWGTLPDLPGLGFLPKKPFTPPQLPAPALDTGDGTTTVAARPQGIFGKMMARALEAQEAQKASASAQESEKPSASRSRPSTTRALRSAATAESTNGSTVRTSTNGATRPTGASALRGGNKGRSNGAVTQPIAEPREVPTTTIKYASDLRHRPSSTVEDGDGAGSGPTALPRKKKSRR